VSIEYRKSGVLLTTRVSIPQDAPGFVSVADHGLIEGGRVMLEDPTGTLTVEGWETFSVDDTDATPTRVWTGFIAEHRDGRKNQPTTGTARVIDCDLYDLNALMHLHVLRSNDAKRDAETDVAMVQWLLTSEALTGLVTDEGLVSTDNPIGFLAADRRRTFADDAIRSIIAVAGKTFFVYRDEASGNAALFYGSEDPDYGAPWAATISISNDMADEDGVTCFFPSRDAEVQHEPNDRYGGVSFGWQGEPIYAQSASTIAAMGLLRDSVTDTDRIGLLATAESEAIRYLNVHANEADMVTVSLHVPSTAVNKAYAGQELDIKLVHVDGYETFVTTRIRQRIARPSPNAWIDGSRAWDVDYILWVPPFPADDASTIDDCVPVATFAQLQGENRNGTGPETYDLTWNNSGDNPDAQHDVAPLTGLVAYDVPVASGGSGFEALGTGLLSVTLLADVALVATGDYVAEFQVTKNGLMALSQGHTSSGGLRFESWTTSPLTGTIAVVAGDILRVRYLDNAPYSTDTFPAGVDATDFTVSGSLCDTPEEPLPYAGDPIGPETATGTIDNSNTDFATAGPWLPGTLRVLHDGIDQTAHVTTSDPIAGTYTLDYAPSTGSTLRETYESA